MGRNYLNNVPATTLNGAVNNTVTTWTVANGTGYPAVPFAAKCESEVVEVTAKSGTNDVTWTVTRGFDNSTAAAHSDGVDVTDAVIADDLQRWTDANRRVYNVVTDYGADPTGDTDSTAAIQAAFDAIPNAGGAQIGAKVVFPEGAYKITSTLTCDKSSVVIEGMGGKSTTETVGHYARGATIFADTGTYTGNVAVNFGGGHSSTDHMGPVIRNINISEVGTSRALTLLAINSYNYWYLENVTLRAGNIGLYVSQDGGSDNAWWTMIGVHAYSNTTGFQIKGDGATAPNGQIYGGSIVVPDVSGAIGLDVTNSSVVRMFGTKLTGPNNTSTITGVKCRGASCLFSGLELERFKTPFDINGSGTSPSGKRNVVSACQISTFAEPIFTIGANAEETHILDNRYGGTITASAISDSGTGTTVRDSRLGNRWTGTPGNTNGTLAVRTKAGVPADADWSIAPPDGAMAVDTTNDRLYARDGGAWKYTSLGDQSWSDFAGSFVNVKDYGAVGDGSTDDSSAIQSAITAAEAVTGKASVFFPPGRYKCVTGLTCNTRVMRFWSHSGQGRSESPADGATLIAATNAMELFRFQTGTALVHEGPVFENLNFRDESTAKTATLLHIHNTNRWTIRNCTFRDASGTGGVGLYLTRETGGDNSWNLIEQCTFTSNETSIKSEHGSFTMVGGHITGATAWGINLNEDTQHVKLLGIKIDDNAILMEGTKNAVIGCSFEGCDPSIRINDTGTGQRGKRNMIVGCNFTGASTETGIDLAGTDPSDNQIIGNTFTALATYISYGGSRNVIEGQYAGLAWELTSSSSLDWRHRIVNATTTSTMTLPDNATYDGHSFTIRRDGANTITIAVSGTDDFQPGGATSKSLDSSGAVISVFSIGDGHWKILYTYGTVT